MPEDHIDCQHGSIDVFGMKIHDHESLGVVTIAEALAHSSDVAAIKVGMKLGDQRLYHYIHDYGFGQQTGIELPGETRGLAKPVSRWSKVSIGAISMARDRRYDAANHLAGLHHRERWNVHAAAYRGGRAFPQ